MSLQIGYFEAGAATPQRLQSGTTESVDSPIGLLIGGKCTLLKLRWIRRRWRGPGEWGEGGAERGRVPSENRVYCEAKFNTNAQVPSALAVSCQHPATSRPCVVGLWLKCNNTTASIIHTFTWGRIYELVWWWNDFTLCVVKAVNKLTLILWAQSITWLASHLRLWLLALYWTVTTAECSKVHESVRVFAHVCMFVKFPHVSNAAFHRDGF